MDYSYGKGSRSVSFVGRLSPFQRVLFGGSTVCKYTMCYACVDFLRLVLRSQHTPHSHPAFQHGNGSHDQDITSRDIPAPPPSASPPEEPLPPTAMEKDQLLQTTPGERKLDISQIETTVFIEPVACEERTSRPIIPPPDAPKSHQLHISPTGTPSPMKKEPPGTPGTKKEDPVGTPGLKKKGSPGTPTENSSPRSKKSRTPKKRKSTSSLSDMSYPVTEQSLLSPTESSQDPNLPQPLPPLVVDPCKEQLPASQVEASSPSKEKRKKGKGEREGGHRKHSRKRKRGLSTSSSDDPKSSRSRTESGGSELLDMCDSLPGDEDLPYISITIEDGPVENQDLLQVPSSTTITASELQTTELEQTSKGEKSKVLFDLTTFNSPAQTSSPIDKDGEAKKKKERRKRGEDGQKRKRSKRKRLQSSSSNEEAPARSESRSESHRSETPASSVLSPIDFSSAEPEAPNYCFTKTQPPYSAGILPPETEGTQTFHGFGEDVCLECFPKQKPNLGEEVCVECFPTQQPKSSRLPSLSDGSAVGIKSPECSVCITKFDVTPSDDYTEC